jgi:hypothetical protein
MAHQQWMRALDVTSNEALHLTAKKRAAGDLYVSSDKKINQSVDIQSINDTILRQEVRYEYNIGYQTSFLS